MSAGRSIGDLRHLRDEGEAEQLSLEVGIPPELEDVPRYPTLAFSGPMDLKGDLRDLELDIGDELGVTVSGPDGTVIASGVARVNGVPILEHEETARNPAWIERRHKAKIKPR